jgi:hypothetical protein
MTIRISIPSISIINGFNRELLNRGINVLQDEDLTSKIREILTVGFQDSLSLNQGLFGSRAMDLEISIEVRDDLGEVTPDILATFDLHRSDLSGYPHFSVSAHLILAEFLAKVTPDDPAVNIRQNAFWSHELVHAADWATLSRHSKIFDDQSGKHLMASFNDPYSSNCSEIPREWELLLVMAKFRSEGLAVLFEYLCGERTLTLTPPVAMESFKSIFTELLNFSSRDFQLSWTRGYVDNEAYGAIFKKSEKYAYLAGPYAAIDVIAVAIASSANDRLMQISQAVIRHLNENIPINLDRSTAIELIRTGLHIDLGSFIQRISDTSFEHPWGQLLDFAQVGWICNFYSYHGDEPNNDFILNIYDAVLHQNHELFLKELMEVIGAIMKLDEIEEGVEKLARSAPGTGADPAVHDEVLMRAKKLLDICSGTSTPEQKEIALAALTYFVDPEDYIRDDLDFAGEIDDLYVLRAASVLCSVYNPIYDNEKY